MHRLISWFVIAVCGVACAAQTGDVADNESKVVGALRTINTSQVVYQSTYNKGFACHLQQLGPVSKGAKPSARAAGLISEELASGKFAGYTLQLNCTPDDFHVIAVPEANGAGAAWCIDKSAVVRTADKADKCVAEGKVPTRQERGK